MASRAVTGRAIAIVVALVLAVVAGFLLWRYVTGAEERALEGTEVVQVWVASDTIPAGTTLEAALAQGLIEQDEALGDNRPESAISAPGDVSGQVATADILPKTVIQRGQWSEPGTSSADLKVPDDAVAVSLQFGVPAGLGGYLSVGDRVAVVAHIQAGSTTTDDAGQATTDPEVDTTRAEYVTRDGEVLAIGQRTVQVDQAGAQQDQVQTGTEQVLATLAVAPEDAERLVFASNEGVLHLVLKPDTLDLPNTPGRTFDNLFEE